MTGRGALAQQVLETLWSSGELTVRDVRARLDGGHAYTTILTVLDRLHDKGRVRRRKLAGAWHYRCARPREAEVGAELTRLLGTPGLDRDPMLLAFLDSAESLDPDLLDRLEDLIRRRREEA